MVWIAESDDWAEVTFLEKMVPVFSENENLTVAYSDMYYVDEHGNEISETYENYTSYSHPTLWLDSHFYKGKDYVKNFMLNKCLIVNASAVLFKKESGIKHINQVLDYKIAGDWLFWNMLLAEENAYVYYSGKEKLNYFRHSTQSTRNYPSIEKKQNGLTETTNVIFVTLKALGLEQERVAVKKREMLDWWSRDHNFIEALGSSFNRILKTPLFQDTSVFMLYKHYLKYRIKSNSLIKYIIKK